MKPDLTLFAFALIPTAAWAFKGVNMGGCLEQADWLNQFNIVKAWGFDSVRLYASASCDTIMRAAPAAIAANITLLAGIWAVPDDNYASEKAAFLNAVQTYGTSYLAAVSVGSESLYRKEIDPNLLASRVKDVKSDNRCLTGANNPGAMRSYAVPVGCTDTWTSWVDPVNNVVTEAVDVVITNGFPYWQGSAIEGANSTFYQSYVATQNAVNAVVPGKVVWVGETGWPTGGDTNDSAVPSIPNLQSYWSSTGCWLMNSGVDFWWYAPFDAPGDSRGGVEEHFGCISHYIQN